MNQVHYQLDLLMAINQKLSTREKMYTMICEASSCAYLYYSFEKNQIVTVGRWKELFDFDIRNMHDVNRVIDEMEEDYAGSLRDVLFLEKTGNGISAMECKHKDGKRWYSFRTTVDYDGFGTPRDKLIVVENTTMLKRQNDELSYMARYDSMTGLYSRNHFVSLLGGYISRAEAEQVPVSVMIIDIDDFKKINEGIGKEAGDELIQAYAEFLKGFSGQDTMVAHLHDDVYCVALYNPSGKHSPEGVHQAIQERAREPFVFGEHSAKITVSIGVAEYPEAAKSALELMNSAEIVMFRCKTKGKNRIEYFNTPVLHDFLQDVELDNKVKEATFNHNFTLHFQPQFYAENRKMRGLEALIRWKDKDGHMISPGVFIPIAERNGCIVPIGNWVAEESVRIYSEWRQKYKKPFIVTINISSMQCSQDDFVDIMLGIIDKYHVEPGEVEIEVTESILIDDYEKVVDKLVTLREHGIRVSLDDFGTGYSSLSYLKKLPIDTLKIDKSFVDTILTDDTTKIITQSILNMVKSLGIQSIAEGVEEEDQFDYLKSIGCDMIQGYLLGRPQPPESIEAILEKSL